MNNYIKSMKALMLSGLSVIAFSACSDWTDVESVNLLSPTLETQNPQLYEAYLQEVRNYKLSEHRVMIVKFDNPTNYPSGRGEHLSALPDSTDYVILNNPDNLHEAVAKEMKEINVNKGTKVLFSIDYAAIEKEYQQAMEKTEDIEDENTVQDGFLDFCTQRMDYYISLFDKYEYDGISVVYNGVSLPGLLQDEKALLASRQEVFFSKINTWKEANPDAVLLFEGKPQNTLYDKSFFNSVRYIIVPSYDATSSDLLLYGLQQSVTDGVSTDKYVYGVTMPYAAASGNGYFSTSTDVTGEKMYAVTGTASTVVSSKGNYPIKGICVDHVQVDYYNYQKSYQSVREAINLMNPSI